MAIINGFHESVEGVSKCMEDGVGLSFPSKLATKERFCPFLSLLTGVVVMKPSLIVGQVKLRFSVNI